MTKSSEVIRVAQDAKENYEREKKKYKLADGRVVKLQDYIDKIITSANSITPLVDAATALDPTNHAPMIWAGVKFFLEVSLRGCLITGIAW